VALKREKVNACRIVNVDAAKIASLDKSINQLHELIIGHRRAPRELSFEL
jgi:hypothetical protein